MALVAPTICRYTVNGTMPNGVTWANIMDMEILSNEEATRSEAVVDGAATLWTAWVENIAGITCDAVTMTSVSYLDLATDDGPTGEYSGGSETGDLAQAPSPANVAILVRKGGGGQRGTRPGRWYQIGTPEANADWSSLTAPWLDTVQTAFDGFLSDLISDDGAAHTQPVVVHTRNEGTEANPDIVYNGFTIIDQLVVQQRLATQRRRLRR